MIRALLQSWRLLLRRRNSYPRDFSANPKPVIPSGILLEEETLPGYEADAYYPVHIGEVLKSRYQVSGKLGYGVYSTNWLCRDFQKHKYITLKVSTCMNEAPESIQRESKVYKHLSTIRSTHPGQRRIRGLYDSFDLESSTGRHKCLVHQPMHMNAEEAMRQGRKWMPFNLELLKSTVHELLNALDYLHTEAKVIHTDLKADNLMMYINDKTMLDRFEIAEMNNPSPRKPIDRSRTIYQSRRIPKPKGDDYGFFMLCDFGEARLGTTQEKGDLAQPDFYRAPEVMFEMPWGPPVDIWNLGALIWDLFEDEHLFKNVHDSEGNHDLYSHTEQIVSLIGPPPDAFVKQLLGGDRSFEADGNWLAEEYAGAELIPLQERETRLDGQEKTDFVAFMQSMLEWMPEERKTAAELLHDPWLKS